VRPTKQITSAEQTTPELPLDAERRIRRGMRLYPQVRSKKGITMRATIARLTLVAGAVFLGWTGSALWHK